MEDQEFDVIEFLNFDESKTEDFVPSDAQSFNSTRSARSRATATGHARLRKSKA